MLKDLVSRNRSYRRFDQSHAITRQSLDQLIDLARLSATGGNLQPLKFILSCDKEKNDLIFPNLAWAGYLKDWDGPEDGEKPSAYVIILGDTEIRNPFGCDHGIAAQSILLGAVEMDLGGCMIMSIQKGKLAADLNIPDRYEILLVIALGKPAEKVVIDPIGPDASIEYWRDETGIHHVPKRSLDEIILP